MADGEIEAQEQPTERQTETPPAAPKSKGGRPKKARGAANSADSADARWTVRGVPVNVRDMAVKAALKRGMTVGDWLAEVVAKAARADAKGVSADGAINLPAATVADTLQALTDRLTKLEQERSKGFLGRLFGGRSAAIALMVSFLGVGGAFGSTVGLERYFSGEKYLNASPTLRQGYVAGVFDSHIYEIQKQHPGLFASWINACTDGWTDNQLAAVVDKYIRAHPDRWHFDAAELVLRGIADTCRSGADGLSPPKDLLD